MEFVSLCREEYQGFFISSPYHNFWQSIEMANMREEKGWKIHYVGVKEGNQIQCACALHALTVYRDYQLFMAPRGFLLDYHNEQLFRFFMDEMIKYLKEHKCLYMKLDPYISYQQHDIEGNPLEELGKEDQVIELLKQYGFEHQGFRTHHDDNFEPRWMSVLDLKDKTEDEILKQMQSMTRRNINSTTKNGIKVKKLKREELSILEKVVEDTGNRKNFNKPDLAYYENFYDYFGEHMEALCAYLDTDDYIQRVKKELAQAQSEEQKLKEQILKNPEAKKTQKRLDAVVLSMETLKKKQEEAHVLKQEHGSEIPLAASMFVIYPNEIVYLFGGSYTEFHSFKGSYAIQWHMICKAIKSGIPHYNFYGISGNFDKTAEDYGVYLFKKGFHADVIELLGDFIYIGMPSAYRQYQTLRKIKHTILRR